MSYGGFPYGVGPIAGNASTITTTVAVVVPVTVAPVVPTRSSVVVSRPVSDINMGGWLPNNGASLFAKLSKTSPDDTTYIQATTLSTCEIATGPTTSLNNTVQYRATSSSGNGITVAVYVSGVFVASWSHTLTTDYALYTQKLTTAQATQLSTGVASIRITATE